jgi:hypothetical protein
MNKNIEGMDMAQAWEAAGVSGGDARTTEWYAMTSTGRASYVVFTVWLESPYPLIFKATPSYDQLVIREPPALQDSFPPPPRLRSYWVNLHMLTSKEMPVRILAVKHRRDTHGKFRKGLYGNAIPLWIRDYKSRRYEETCVIALSAEDSQGGWCPDCGLVGFEKGHEGCPYGPRLKRQDSAKDAR